MQLKIESIEPTVAPVSPSKPRMLSSGQRAAGAIWLHPQSMALSGTTTPVEILRELAAESHTSLRSVRRCLELRETYPDLFIAVLRGWTMKDAFRQKANRDNPFEARMRAHEDPNYRAYVSGGENARFGHFMRIFLDDGARIKLGGIFYGIGNDLEDMSQADVDQLHARYAEIADPFRIGLSDEDFDSWDRLVFQMVRCLLVDVEAGIQFRDARLAEYAHPKRARASVFGLEFRVCPQAGFHQHLMHLEQRMIDMVAALRITAGEAKRLRARHAKMHHPDKVDLVGFSRALKSYWCQLIFKPMTAALSEIARALTLREASLQLPMQLPMHRRLIYPENTEDMMRVLLAGWEQADSERLEELSRLRRERA